jgi:arylsulfatase A-like enzyme
VGRKMPHEQDAENVFDYGNSYAQVEKELEQYDLQVKQEQELNPYRIEPEENLPKEQEEHFRQIRRYYMDLGSFVS